MLVENFVLVGIEACCSHIRRNRHANRVADTLTEWAGGALYSRRVAKFGMSRGFGMQLPETFDFRHRQIVAAHVQPGVKKHAAVPGGEHEDIAIDPAGLLRIISQRITKKHRADFRATERKSEMARLRGLYCVHA